MPAETSAGYSNIIGSGTDLAIAAGIDTTIDIVPVGPLWYQTYELPDAGGTPYTVKFTIDRTDQAVIEGAFIRLKLILDAGTDATAEVYDDTIGGTKLATVTAVADSTNTFLFEGVVRNGVWTQYDGRYKI